MAFNEKHPNKELKSNFPPKLYKQTSLHFGSSNFSKITDGKHIPRLIGTHHRKCKTTKRNHDSITKIQTLLDLGQKELGFSICLKCGMAFNSANSNDSQMHNKLHTHLCYPSCLHISGFSEEDLISHLDFKIIRVTKHSSTKLLGRARLLWEYLQSEHGFVVKYLDFATSDMQLFICIHEEMSKIVGCCFAEEICEANRIILNAGESTPSHASTATFPARIGIDRLWVHSLHRRFKVATHLVNTVKLRFFKRMHVSIDLLAFSDPSPEGIAFALKYFGRKDFLIYFK